jgi:hypothetical protein
VLFQSAAYSVFRSWVSCRRVCDLKPKRLISMRTLGSCLYYNNNDIINVVLDMSWDTPR